MHNKIIKLKFPDTIRLSAGMYLGCTSDADNLYKELIDNSVDEILNGRATALHVFTTKNAIVIVDNGSGIPVHADPDDKNKSIIESILTDSHTGSKFNHISKEITSGLHGIGLKATNALSSSFICYVNLRFYNPKMLPKGLRSNWSENSSLYIRYNKGILETCEVVKHSQMEETVDGIEDWSTCIVAFPDEEIFDSTEGKVNETSLSIVKLLYPDSKLYLNGKEIQKLKLENIFPVNFIDDTSIEFMVKVDEHIFMIKLAYSNDDFENNAYGSVNTISSSGFHVSSIESIFCEYMNKKIDKVQKQNWKYGLRLFIVALTNSPQFSSQTKERLTKIEGTNKKEIKEHFIKVFDTVYTENKEFFEKVGTRIFNYVKELGKLNVKDLVNDVVIRQDRKKANGVGVHVYDAVNKNRQETELFITEGQSASGGLVQARDVTKTAILPLRGKPLNSTKVNLEKILGNKEMLGVINCIGAGVHPYTDLSNIRYGKIILTADPDPDGKAINSLLLGNLAILLPEAIKEGYVYVVDIPLFKQGKKYIWNPDELDVTKPFTRFKGLGEMQTEELYDVCINPKTRKLIKILPTDMDEAITLVKTSTAKKEIMKIKGIIA